MQSLYASVPEESVADVYSPGARSQSCQSRLQVATHRDLCVPEDIYGLCEMSANSNKI